MMDTSRDKTFVRMFRKSLNDPLFSEKPFDRWHAFEYLIYIAYRFPKDEIVNGQVIHIDTGQLIMSQRKMAEIFGWSINKVIRFKKLLEQLGKARFDVDTYGDSIGTLITIENYAKYQVANVEDGDTNETTNETTDGDNIKKVKKVNKVKNNIYNAPARARHTDGASANRRFEPPTVKQVEEYCRERGNSVDTERFIDFYESKGWMVGKNKMKDWKAAVRNWERNKASKSVQSEDTGRLGWIDEI